MTSFPQETKNSFSLTWQKTLSPKHTTSVAVIDQGLIGMGTLGAHTITTPDSPKTTILTYSFYQIHRPRVKKNS